MYLPMERMITGGNKKSFGEVDQLATIVTSPDFDVDKLVGFSASGASHLFGQSENPKDKGPYTGNQYSIGQQEFIGSLSKFLSSWATLLTPSWHPQVCSC